MICQPYLYYLQQGYATKNRYVVLDTICFTGTTKGVSFRGPEIVVRKDNKNWFTKFFHTLDMPRSCSKARILHNLICLWWYEFSYWVLSEGVNQVFLCAYCLFRTNELQILLFTLGNIEMLVFFLIQNQPDRISMFIFSCSITTNCSFNSQFINNFNFVLLVLFFWVQS